MEWMVSRNRQEDGIVEYAVVFESRYEFRIAAEGQIQFPFFEQRSQVGRAAFQQIDLDAGIGCTEPGQQGGQDMGVEVVRAPDPKISGDQVGQIF